jgi:hypothetical protein
MDSRVDHPNVETKPCVWAIHLPIRMAEPVMEATNSGSTVPNDTKQIPNPKKPPSIGLTVML